MAFLGPVWNHSAQASLLFFNNSGRIAYVALLRLQWNPFLVFSLQLFINSQRIGFLPPLALGLAFDRSGEAALLPFTKRQRIELDTPFPHLRNLPCDGPEFDGSVGLPGIFRVSFSSSRVLRCKSSALCVLRLAWHSLKSLHNCHLLLVGTIGIWIPGCRAIAVS